MTNDTGAGTMHIGEVAEKTGLSLRTLRHYDEIGLVTASGRTEGGFRLYTDHDLSRLLLIRRMKPLRFPLENMIELLRVIDVMKSNDPNAPSSTEREQFDRFLADAVERRQDLHEQLVMADEFLDLLRQQ